ncbi:hypothetical protein PTKIN_Ptkin04bG0057100 [Pterospermum kingtungense]
MLLHYLSTISPPEPLMPPKRTTSENVALPPESLDTSSLMAAGKDVGETLKAADHEDRPRSFFFYFNQCY